RESLVLFDLHPKRRVRDRRQILRCHDLSTPFRAIVMFTVDMTVSTARVAHIGIAVPSIDAALRFYRDVLGLEPGRPETADGATIVSLALGDVHVELSSRVNRSGRSRNSSRPAGRGSITCATVCPISTVRSNAAERTDTVWWTKCRGGAPAAGASRSSIRRRRPAFW